MANASATLRLSEGVPETDEYPARQHGKYQRIASMRFIRPTAAPARRRRRMRGSAS